MPGGSAKENTICKHCRKKMSPFSRCSVTTFTLSDGRKVKRRPYRDISTSSCPECNVKSGSCHHHGCPLERCPMCGGHIVTCKCFIK